ncbi:MAG: ornithine cyclodeaminase family protein [Chloroflexi bacterium]|nr:ornithine cyclodeaminase family protein [Chloroflexota bacterium]
MSTMFLSRSEVRDLLDMREVIGAVEQAFKDWAQGKAKMPTKSYMLVEKGDFRAMPGAIPGAAGVKWVNVHLGNSKLGLPSIMAILIYSDPDTGYPLAIMDATDITAYRTGATAAIASKYLARKNSRTLGLVGAGHQAYTQLMAHAGLFKLKEIKAFDIKKEAVDKLIKTFPQHPIKGGSLEDTVASDIVCTITPAREPVVKKAWVKPGTHINAIGADAEGKEELEPSILKEAMVVVDDMKQSSLAGEINVPVRKGLYKVEDVYGTLGEVISGKKRGRADDRAITIFDSTGVAIEDIATAQLVYKKAKAKGGYLSREFVEE